MKFQAVMDVINSNITYDRESCMGGEAAAENGNTSSNASELSEVITQRLKTCEANDADVDDEPCTAPFEILAEFLSSLMSKDYKNALSYCKQILQYEPNNMTVREFHPLIEKKLQLERELCASDESGENSDDGSDDSAEYYSSASSDAIEDEEEESDDDGDGNASSEANDDNSVVSANSCVEKEQDFKDNEERK